MAIGHASYRVLITRALKNLNPFNKTYISPISLKKYICEKYNLEFLKISNYYFRRALKKMVESSVLQKHESKYLFRITPKNAIKKKSNKTQKPSQKTKAKKVPIKSTSKKITKTKDKATNPSPAPLQNLTKSISKSLSKKKSLKPAKNPVKGQPIWQYYDKFNVEARVQNPDGWYNYDLKASDIVEEEWQKYIKNRMMCDVRSVKSGHFEYCVDFMNWNQTNMTHHNHKVRKIRRLDENGDVTQNPYQ